MAWIRLDDDYIYHPKFICLSDSAFRLWHEGMAYCRKTMSDGFIPAVTLKMFRSSKRKNISELTTSETGHTTPLWDTVEGGYRVHDYLQWNPCKEDELANRENDRLRAAMNQNPELRSALRARDGNNCRYCGEPVNWNDRKGSHGATYDHIVPRGPATLENLVIACRRCNSVKGNRPLAESGLVLLPPPDKSIKNLGANPDSRNRTESVFTARSLKREAPMSGTTDDALAERAGRFCERYAELYPLHRRGARYLPKPALDYVKACELCQVWDNERLERLAIVFLKCEEPFAQSGSRTIGQFAAMASWADDRLREVEAKSA